MWWKAPLNNKLKANMYIHIDLQVHAQNFISFIEIARVADYWIKLD